MKKYKALLVCERSGVLPLGPGCLKAFADADRRLARLASVSLVYVDDLSAAAQVLAQGPDLVGFSCCGDLTGVFSACAGLKKLAPGLRIVLGGPAVSAIAPEELFAAAPFDYAVRGEGEAAFRDLLLCLARGGRGLEEVPGLLYRRGAAVAANPPGPALPPGKLPSPYLAGVFDLGRHSKFFVEGSRGCGSRCRYCAESQAALRWFGAARLRREVRYIIDHAPNASIIAPTDADFFLDRARAKSLLETFRGIGGDRRLTFVFACNPRSWDADIMAALGCERFRVSVGVQSLNPAALKAAGRPGGPAAIKSKIRELLRLAPGVRFSIDLIEGLPGDDLAGYARTLDWAVSTGGDIEMNHLMVLHGTAFSEQKRRFGIVCENNYPYSLVSTSTFPAADLKRAKALNARVWPILRRFSLDRFITFSVRRLGGALRGALPRPYLSVCGELAAFMDRRREFAPLAAEWHKAAHGGYDSASSLRARAGALAMIPVFAKGLLARYGRSSRYPAFAADLAAAGARLNFREGAARRGAQAAELRAGASGPELLVCQADSDEPRYFPGCRALLVKDFFSDETWGGREGPAGAATVEARKAAEHFSGARAGAFGRIIISGVLSGLPARERLALLRNLHRQARAGGSLLVFDDLAGTPGAALRRPGAGRVGAELAAAGWDCAEPPTAGSVEGMFVFNCLRRPGVRRKVS